MFFWGDGSITYSAQNRIVVTDNLNNAIPSIGQGVIFFCSTYQPVGIPAYTSNFWQGFTLKADGIAGYYVQIATGLGGELYIRTKYENEWLPWTQIH